MSGAQGNGQKRDERSSRSTYYRANRAQRTPAEREADNLVRNARRALAARDARNEQRARRAQSRLARYDHDADENIGGNAGAPAGAPARLPEAYRYATSPPAPLDLGTRTYCGSCSAKVWVGEQTAGDDTKYFICCGKGKVRLAPLDPVPERLRALYEREDARSANFFDNIRPYNSALAFASIQVNLPPIPGRGPYCYRINGQMYRRIASPLPRQGEEPRYAQLYFIETEQAHQARLRNPANQNMDPTLLTDLEEMMDEFNPLARQYKRMKLVADQHTRNGGRVSDIRFSTMATEGELGLHPGRARWRRSSLGDRKIMEIENWWPNYRMGVLRLSPYPILYVTDFCTLCFSQTLMSDGSRVLRNMGPRGELQCGTRA